MFRRLIRAMFFEGLPLWRAWWDGDYNGRQATADSTEQILVFIHRQRQPD